MINQVKSARTFRHAYLLNLKAGLDRLRLDSYLEKSPQLIADKHCSHKDKLLRRTLTVSKEVLYYLTIY
jgi:hypothetical protein